MLAGARVLGLLDNYDLVLLELARDNHRRGQRGVAGGPALEALDVRKQLRREEDLSLGDRDVSVQVAEAARGIARHIDAVGVDVEGEAEAGVPGGEGLAVEVPVAGHVESGQVHAGADDLRLIRAAP